MLGKNDNPWEMLENPDDGQLSSQRVRAEFPFDFYFSKDSAGTYMLVFSLSHHSVKYEKIQLNGVLVSNISIDDTPSIVLSLKNNVDWPIFLRICIDLCSVASESPSVEKAVAQFYNRLIYWQYFLKRNTDDKLSKEEQIGLIGELLVLKKYILSQYCALDSVNFWTGADSDVQDFFIDDKRVEVKTCSSPSKNEVCISSLQQLFNAECPIYLVVVYLGVSSNNTADAFTLFSLASNIAVRLRDENVQAYELYIKKLAMVGLFLDGSYNDTFYLANKFRGFSVQNEFPKITPNDVKAGIIQAKYVINLGACLNYELPLVEVFQKE
jgi:hypothetical protein